MGGPWWAQGDPPPRPGNALDVLIDGEDAFRAIAQALQGARSHVHVTGWHLTPGFALTRDANPISLRDLLADLATRIPVRVLLWGGAPGRLFRPSRRDVRRVRDQLVAGTRIQCALDTRERPMHCHHEKTVIVDDQVAFVGGIDLTSFGGDRWDTPAHPSRQAGGWHDVATRLRGPAVQDVAAHFRLRWHAITGETLPAWPIPAPAGSVEVQLVRTMPDHMYRERPQGDFRILEAYLRALRGAIKLIYLENQFLWSPEVAEVLRDKLRHPPSPDFRLLLVLPEKPNSGGDDTRGQLSTLVEADEDRGNILACTILCSGGVQPPAVYVHAKVGIIDDRWLTVGSANLNEHSLFNDTEVNLVAGDPDLARATRLRLWSEHLQRPIADVGGDPARVIDNLWKPIAREQADRRRKGQPPTHRLLELTRGSRRAGLVLGPLQGLIVDA